MGPIMQYTNKFYDVVDKINDKISHRIIEIEADPTVHNALGITYVDVSNKDWEFLVTMKSENGKTGPDGGTKVSMKIGRFIRYFLSGEFNDNEIYSFSVKYNIARKGGKISAVSNNKYQAPLPKRDLKKIEVPSFRYNPRDVRSTFLSLVTKTYPHGHEEEVIGLLAPGLKKDGMGNYYKIIGNSNTMFTCHLDTADRVQSKVNLYSEMKDGQEYIVTDGRTILGADDKAGVAVLLYMMSHNIPGLYYFFIGEERGGIGSRRLSNSFDSVPYMKDIKKCISFDRRNYYSVITSQMCTECCSDEFGNALAAEFNKSGLKLTIDPTGIYTDSASFIEQIPECTNVSVGYMHEHTSSEYQNMTYLIRLCEASIKVNWDKLPIVRKVGFDDNILIKYSKFIKDFKSCVFNMNTKFVTEYGRSYVTMEMEDIDIESAHSDIVNVSILLNRHKMDPDISFEDEYVKIELR